MELSKLTNRAGINKRHTQLGEVVLYEDHRTILNVLYFLKQDTDCKINFPINIIMFDKHDDGVFPTEDLLEKIKIFHNASPSIREFWEFVEFDLSPLDDNWVKVGMEMGLINDCFLFNATETSIGFLEEYPTTFFGKKRTFNIGSIWNAIKSRGCLGDIIRKDKYGELWEALGWKYEQGYFNFSPTIPYIMDFGLDCFTTTILDQTVAIPHNILEKKLGGRTNFVMQDFIEKSILTTICFENGYCGGYIEAFKIFDNLDNLFFNGKLGQDRFS